MAEFKNEFTYKGFLEAGREAEFDTLFDNSVAKVKRESLGKKHPICIDGKEVYAGAEIVEYSPIDGTVIGTFQKGGRDIARQAIDFLLRGIR